MIDPIEVLRATFDTSVISKNLGPAIVNAVRKDGDPEEFEYSHQVIAKGNGTVDVVVWATPIYFSTYYAAEVAAQHYIEQVRVNIEEELGKDEDVTNVTTIIRRLQEDRWTCLVRIDAAEWHLSPDGQAEYTG